MNGATLSRAMLGRLSTARYNQLAPGITQALQRANCTTVNRAAMFCAQVGTESGGLQWMEELASGQEYEGRRDLGNTHAGDGRRFKGRGPIQITGRNNYTKLSQWAHSKGYVSTSTYFVDHPEKLSELAYVWLGPVWYWTVARNMNGYADRGDIRGATLAVNGGTNGLADRTNRWNTCRTIGTALLAGGAPATYYDDLAHWFTTAQIKQLQTKVGSTADGVIGVNTLKAVQKAVGVTADGVIGKATVTALQKKAGLTGKAIDGLLGKTTAAAVVKWATTAAPKPAPKPKTTTFPLPKGHAYAMNDGTAYTHSGVNTKDRPAIKRIQTKVGVTADGIYGPATATAVGKQQTKHKLKADKQVGPSTWKALAL